MTTRQWDNETERQTTLSRRDTKTKRQRGEETYFDLSICHFIYHNK